jgi:hypothetical protein
VLVVGLGLGELVDLVFRIVEGYGVVLGIHRWFDKLFHGYLV